MNDNQNFIGVDLGGESGRVVVGSFDGQKIQLSEKHRFATGGTKVGSTLRWDVPKFWEEIQRGLALAAADEKSITSVGVDTWGVDYALLDANEDLLELPYHYRDDKNLGTLDQILAKIPKEELFAHTGNQFMEINTLYQLFAHLKAGDALKNAHHLLTTADYFHWCMCGSKTVEFTMATTTQCFDPTTRDWAKPILEKLGIPTGMLPEVVEPGTDLGMLRSSVAEATGLNSVSVVTPATHDTGSAIAAVPVSKDSGPNWAYISSGTWSLVGIEIDHPVLSAEALAANVTNEGGVDGTWRFLKNVIGLWIVQRLKLAFSERGFDRNYEELTKLAASAESPGCYIDPDDGCFLNPDNMEQAIFDYCKRTNQPEPQDEGSTVRCVLESLALRYCQVLSEVSSLAETKIDVLHIVGGGSRNGLLNQFISDAAQIPVVAGPSEATVLGNVLIQCRTAGALNSLSDIREVVRNSSDLVNFEPKDSPYWSDALARFETLSKLPNA